MSTENERPTKAVEFVITEHHWSGWPGAWCFHCGRPDPLEHAIGAGWCGPYTDSWDTDEHREQYEQANACMTTRDRLTRDVCPQCPEEEAES